MKPSRIFGACDNIKGNVASLFAVLLFPILVGVAFTIDIARQIGTSRNLQFAVDTAALAGANALQNASLTEKQIQSRMIGIFNANKPPSNLGATCAEPVIDFLSDDAYAVELEVTCQLPTLLGASLSGKDTIEITRSAYSTISLPTLDIALMLDMSQSMDHGGRLPALKSAAKSLVARLITAESGKRVRIALIPYGEAVNAGVYGNRAQGKADDDDSDIDGDKVCVTHRQNTDSRFTDAAPSEDNYVGDDSGAVCKTPMILPLSSDSASLNAAIDSLTARGYNTAGHIGLAWSWYAISSNWNDVWPDASEPNPNDEPSSIKAVVMMSDGIFNRHHDYGSREAYLQSASDTMDLCSNMRAAGTIIYAVGLDITPPSHHWITQEWLENYGPETVFEHCVGDVDRFYQPTASSELDGMYQEISEKLEIESVRLAQ